MSRLSQKARQHRANLRDLSDRIAEDNEVDHREADNTLEDDDFDDAPHPFDRAKELVDWTGRKRSGDMKGISFCGYSTRVIAFELNHQDRLTEIAEENYPASADEDPDVHRYYAEHQRQIDRELDWLWAKRGEYRAQGAHEVWVYLNGKNIEDHPYRSWVPRMPGLPAQEDSDFDRHYHPWGGNLYSFSYV